jgi:hypothetical protein
LANLESRTYEPGDEYGIVKLYNKITGRCRTNAQYRWEWLQTPHGAGSIWIIAESESGDIVGHHGLLPFHLDYFGKTFLLGKTENTVLHPKYSGTGIYFIYEKRFLQEGQAKYDLLCTTFAHGTPGKIRRKLGYQAVGRHLTYTKVIKYTYIKKLITALIEKKIPHRILRLILNGIVHILSYPSTILFSKRGDIEKTITVQKAENIDAIGEQLDRFWNGNKDKFGITVNRTSIYLKWRIFENPYVTYEFLTATKRGVIVGYAITKPPTGDGNEGVIVDLVCDRQDEILFNTILDAAIRHLVEANAHAVRFSTLDSHNFLNRCLVKNGFLPIQKIATFIRKYLPGDKNAEESVLLVKVINKNINHTKMYNPDNWYFTDLFLEGIS